MDNIFLFPLETDKESELLKTPYILENIAYHIEENILENRENDAVDGLLNFIETISNKLQEDYAEIIGEDIEKKPFY